MHGPAAGGDGSGARLRVVADDLVCDDYVFLSLLVQVLCFSGFPGHVGRLARPLLELELAEFQTHPL